MNKDTVTFITDDLPDIAVRLREMFGDDDRCIWCGKHMDSESGPHRDPCDLLTAADEIERLTADRDRWRGLAERAMDLLEEANRVLAQIQEGLKRD